MRVLSSGGVSRCGHPLPRPPPQAGEGAHHRYRRHCCSPRQISFARHERVTTRNERRIHPEQPS
ncbi:hypothetical protein CVM73_33915 [Bradyrhizobium forestalis]|uniref:Uncharacterized protein n=1 Tax=Bradyrhizobium forestalis TaxID=1419263 RepID=A0A2M8QZ91_9BRAD|nr:hypothetical protein CVM73_33915 [Bradyrhizobium forestalis]